MAGCGSRSGPRRVHDVFAHVGLNTHLICFLYLDASRAVVCSVRGFNVTAGRLLLVYMRGRGSAGEDAGAGVVPAGCAAGVGAMLC